MNCFYFTVSTKVMKKILRQDAVLTIPVYQREIIPEEGDRVYFNNFDTVFTIEKVTPALDEEMLVQEHQISEETRGYLSGFFDLALVPLYDDYDLVSLGELVDGGDYQEIGTVAGDAYYLLAKFDAELKLAEAEDGGTELSNIDRTAIVMEANETAAQTFYGRILPTIFNKTYAVSGEGQIYKTHYNPVVAYLDGYMPIAMMLYYGEHALEEEQYLEQIPAAYVDWDLAQDCGLTIEDIQYLVEELFYETLGDFDPETADVILEAPTIMIPSSQAPFYEGLIDSCGWENTGDVGFGYKIFN